MQTEKKAPHSLPSNLIFVEKSLDVKRACPDSRAEAATKRTTAVANRLAARDGILAQRQNLWSYNRHALASEAV